MRFFGISTERALPTQHLTGKLSTQAAGFWSEWILTLQMFFLSPAYPRQHLKHIHPRILEEEPRVAAVLLPLTLAALLHEILSGVLCCATGLKQGMKGMEAHAHETGLGRRQGPLLLALHPNLEISVETRNGCMNFAHGIN